MEVRESQWDIPSGEVQHIEAEAAVLTTTVVTPDQAEAFATKFEELLLEKLGPAAQTAWAWIGNPLGSKLLEIPLEPGDSPARPVQSATRGSKWTGYQDGITATFDEDQATMVLLRAQSDSAFRMRPNDVDPTLANFVVYNALKNSSSGLFITPDGGAGFRVAIEEGGDKKRYFFFSDDTNLLLTRRESLSVGKLLKERTYFGSYGRLTGADTEDGVPYTALTIRHDSPNKVRVRLLTVTRWTAREVPPEELEIKLPRGTKIVRDTLD